MIEIKEKSTCCGCSGCANACSKKCIEMTADEEGFSYPKVNKNECINCGLCEKVCPIINVLPDEPKEQWGYVVQSKDEKVLAESTSGGAFTAIAEYVIENGGIVFGAAFDEELNVIHTAVDNKNDLCKFRNSKYVQSDMGSCFRQAKKHLDEGRLVCFSGTPCQVEGLYHFLGKEYENLILVDVVCHAIPSPLVWKKYLEIQRKNLGDGITNIKFRDKAPYGYKYSMMSVYKHENQIYKNGVETDPMLRAFFSDICDRPSCYKCKFKKRYRVSDFTIWDCFEVDKFSKTLDNDKGVTRILIQNPKAYMLFSKIKRNLIFSEVSTNKLTENVYEMFNSVEENKKREIFFECLNNLSIENPFSKFFRPSIKTETEKILRRILVKLGIYVKIRKTMNVLKKI